MSGPTTTDELVRQLTRELRPVRRLPRLRTVLLGTGIAGLVALALVVLVRGVDPARVAGRLGDPVFTGVLLGLLVLGPAAAVAALAASVPGREVARRIATDLACLATGAVLVPVALLVLRDPNFGRDLSGGLACQGWSLGLGLLPVVPVVVFVSRALPRHPWLTALGAGVAGVAVGALVVHLSCPSRDPAHLLLAHALTPVLGGLLLSLPLLVLGRMLRHRS